ncbi:DUF3667 domain-containing protein [Aliikangiella coralliicola]|nr:DUF3667 domain-containing protein [Aliikangiella coralliicola]
MEKEFMTECLNCGYLASGNFCANCGQNTHTQTITMAKSIRHTFSQVFDYDSRLFVTIREMLVNPGKASLNYVLGKRIRFIHPVKYFIITMGMSLLIMQLLQAEGRVPQAQLVLPDFINIPDDKKQLIAQWVLRYSHFIMLAFVPVCGFFLGLFFGKKRTAGEVTAFLFYLNANLAIITTFLLITQLSPNKIIDTLQGLFAIVYSIWSILVFFQSSFLSGIWRAALAYICYAAITVLVIIMAIKGYLVWFTTN